MSGSRLDKFLDVLAAVPLGGEHEQSLSIRAPEHARKARSIELDALEDLTAFADTSAVVSAMRSRCPDATVGVDADAVRGDLLRPKPGGL